MEKSFMWEHVLESTPKKESSNGTFITRNY